MTPITLGLVLSRMERLSPPEFAVAKSGFPSLLKSPMLMEAGLVPVAKGTWVAKVGVAAPGAVVLSRMEAVLLPAFATAKSGLPSPLKSPMLMEAGLVPVAKGTWVAKVGVAAPVAVVLSRMEAVLLPAFATAKSGLPSPLMSPMLTDWGLLPVVKSSLVAKVGVEAPVGVVLSRMEAVLLSRFAVAKSGFPSPLMSPMLTEKGKELVGKGSWEAKVRVAAPVGVVLSRMETLFSLLFATAKSGLPSPLMSPMLMAPGLRPVAKLPWGTKVGEVAPVGIVLSRMEALFSLMFAKAKSGFPSPLKSPMLMPLTATPVIKSNLGAKVGVVAPVAEVLSRREALVKFAVAKSGLPSPLMSPMLTKLGPEPVVKSTLGAKPSTPL